MPKSKVKLKSKVDSSKKELTSINKDHQTNGYYKKILIFIKCNKYWFLGTFLVLLVIGLLLLSQTWLVKSLFPQAKTYPKASIFGSSVGDLNSDQLSSYLSKLELEFRDKDITLANSNDKWAFKPSDLGITFDVSATADKVLGLNQIGLIDKFKLLKGDLSSVIKPVILLNSDQCTKSLSVIPATPITPEDASFYFDNGLKIKPDKPGTTFNPALTCQGMVNKLADNIYIVDVNLDTLNANISKVELEAKLSQVQSLIDGTLLFKKGGYQKSFNSEQLLGLLSITKSDLEIKVDWLPDKLDEIVNEISSKINTSDSGPSLGVCQYISSNGGNWLDKVATKKIFTDLGAGKPRAYDLPVVYHAPVIKTRSPLNNGTKGTIYLTYDDGMTYSNQIMNYAACYGIKVTFFEIGMRAEADATALRRAIAEGHAVQSHGYEHALYDYGKRSYDWQVEDMRKSIDVITNITGVRPTYFRPPGGNRSNDTYTAASANGLNLIMWGDASRDSAPSGVTSSLTCNNVLAGAFSGASVLMHSTNRSTAEALPCIAEGLAAREYNMMALR